MSNINLNIVGTGNFTQVEAAIKHLQASIAQLNATGAAGPAFQRSVAQSIAQVNALAQAQGLMKVHTTSLATEADKLTKRIAKGKTTFQDFRNAIGGATKANSIYMEVAKKQLAIQNMSAIQVGKTVFGYENLGRAQLSAAAAAQAHATAIAAQNAVLRQSLVHVVNWGKNMQWTGRQLTMGLTMPLVLFGAQAAKIFNEVDKNLTNLAKVYGVGLEQPTTAALQAIRKEMLLLSTELGKTLGISAAEVTDIGAQFAAAGLQGEQLVYATKQAARMVVLGEADKQEAIKATIALQTAYKLNTTELTEAVNFFNAAQAATSTNMADLIGAVPRVGPVIKQLGGTYKDMVAIITALKEGGVPAGEAANAIKNSLARIIQPTEKAKGVLLGFGIDIENIVNKNAGNLTATITELQAGLLKLDGLTRQRAISELFGKYQFSRMSAFIENFGQVGSQSQKVMEMMGLSAAELANIADEQTKKIQQSASGRFRIAVETLKNTMIPIGEATLDMFTKVLEKVTAFFDAVQSLPGPLKTALKWLLLIGGVVGPLTMLAGLFGNLIGTIGMGIVRLKVFGGAIRMLFTSKDLNAAKIILSGFKELDPAVTAASRAVNIFKNEELSAEQVSERFAAMLNQMTGGLVNVQNAAGKAGQIMVTSFEASAAAAATANAAIYANPVMYGAGARGGQQQLRYTEVSHNTSKIALMQDPIIQRILASNPNITANMIGTANKPGTIANALLGASTIIPTVGTEAARYQQLMSSRTQLYYDPNSGMSRSQFLESNLRAAGHGNVAPTIVGRMQSTGTVNLMAKTLQEQATATSQHMFLLDAMLKKGTGYIKEFNAKLQGHLASGNLSAADELLQSELMKLQSEEKLMAQKMTERATRWTKMYDRMIASGMSVDQATNAINTVMARAHLRSFSPYLAAGNLGAYGGAGAGKDIYAGQKFLLESRVSTGMAPTYNPAAAINEIKMAAEAKIAQITKQINEINQQIRQAPVDIKKPGLFAPRAAKTAYADFLSTSPTVDRALQEAKMAATIALQKQTAATNAQVMAQESLTKIEMRLLSIEQKKAAAQSQIDAARQQMEQRGWKTSKRLTEAEAVLASIVEREARLRAFGERIVTNANNLVAEADAAEAAAIEKRTASETLVNRRNEQVAAITGAPGIGRGAMAVGTGAGLLAGLPMMMGAKGEFANTLFQGGMMLSMVTMLGMFSTAIMGMMGPILLATAAIFGFIKVFQAIRKEAEDNAKATQALIGLSKTEAENLGITIRKIGDIPTKDLGDNADQARTSIERLVESFKNLAEDDALRKFIDSLRETAQDQGNENWNVRRLEQKYLQYRAAGATDEAARNQVLALAQSAGIPLAGTEAMRRVQSTSGYTQGEFMVQAQRSGFQALSGKVINSFATGRMTDETNAAARANAENIYNTILFAQGTRSTRILGEIEKQMNKTSASSNYFRASVAEMFTQLGEGANKSQQKMINFGFSTKDQLLGAQLVLNGFVNSWEDLDKLIGTKEFTIKVNQMIQQQEISAAQSSLLTGAEKYLKQTNDARSSSAKKAADAQQTIVDKLKEELETRKKILAAQEKQNQFQLSMAEMQQQFTDALATGDMAKAAILQERMTIEQAKYNEELKTTAMENRIAKEEKKLKSLQDQTNATSKLATATKTASEKLEELRIRIEESILSKGEPTKQTLQGWVKELTGMGVPTETANKLIKDFVKQFSSQVDTRMSSDIVSQLNKILSAEQELLFMAAYRVETQAGKSEMEAARVAFSKAYGQQTYLDSNGKALRISAGPGKSKVVYREGQGLFPGAQSSGYSPEPYTGPQKIEERYPEITSKKYSSKEAAEAAYKRGTALIADNEGNFWSLIKEGSAYYFASGDKRIRAYAMGGLVKSYGMGGKVMAYGMGGKVMNYFGGSWGGIKGPGSWTSDSIPAMVSNGEYVVNAASVSKVGTQFMDQLNSLGYANTAPLMSIISATGSPVIPVEIVPSNNNSSMYNNNSQIFVNVAGTNASAQDIANAISDAQQRRMGTVATRGVIYS